MQMQMRIRLGMRIQIFPLHHLRMTVVARSPRAGHRSARLRLVLPPSPSFSRSGEKGKSTGANKQERLNPLAELAAPGGQTFHDEGIRHRRAVLSLSAVGIRLALSPTEIAFH